MSSYPAVSWTIAQWGNLWLTQGNYQVEMRFKSDDVKLGRHITKITIKSWNQSQNQYPRRSKIEKSSSRPHLFIFIVDDLGFLVPLEPHHVLGVEPPALLLECLGGQILGLGALHVVEDEEQSLRRETLEEVYRVAARRRGL